MSGLADKEDNIQRLIAELTEKYHVGESTKRGDEHVLLDLADKPLSTALAFSRLASRIFREGRWEANMGGPKWADIADNLTAFLSGAIPHGVFVDQVYNLQHNTGHVFNKHPMVIASSSLQEFLNAKRDEPGVEELVKAFIHLTRYFNRVFEFPRVLSLSVGELYRDGIRANLWKGQLT